MQCDGVLTFVFVNDILWCDRSCEICFTELSHGTISFSIFYEMKFGIFLEF